MTVMKEFKYLFKPIYVFAYIRDRRWIRKIFGSIITRMKGRNFTQQLHVQSHTRSLLGRLRYVTRKTKWLTGRPVTHIHT